MTESNMTKCVKLDPPGLIQRNTARQEPKRRGQHQACQVEGNLSESRLTDCVLGLSPSQQEIFEELRGCFSQQDEADMNHSQKMKHESKVNDPSLSETARASTFTRKKRMVDRVPRDGMSSASVARQNSTRELALQFTQSQAVAYIPNMTTQQGQYRVVYIRPTRLTKDKCPDFLRLIAYAVESVQKRNISNHDSSSSEIDKVAILIDMDQYQLVSSRRNSSQKSFTLEDWISLLDLMQGQSDNIKVGRVVVVHAKTDVALVFQALVKAREQDGFSELVHFLDKPEDLALHFSGPVALWPVALGGKVEIRELIKDFLKYRLALEDILDQQNDKPSSLQVAPSKFLCGSDGSHNSSITSDSELEDARRARILTAGKHAPSRSVGAPKSRKSVSTKSHGMIDDIVDEPPLSGADKGVRKQKRSRKNRRGSGSAKNFADEKRSSSRIDESNGPRRQPSKSSKSLNRTTTTTLQKENSTQGPRVSESIQPTEYLVSDSESSSSQRITRKYRMEDHGLTRYDLVAGCDARPIPIYRTVSMPQSSASSPVESQEKASSNSSRMTRTLDSTVSYGATSIFSRFKSQRGRKFQTVVRIDKVTTTKVRADENSAESHSPSCSNAQSISMKCRTDNTTPTRKMQLKTSDDRHKPSFAGSLSSTIKRAGRKGKSPVRRRPSVGFGDRNPSAAAPLSCGTRDWLNSKTSSSTGDMKRNRIAAELLPACTECCVDEDEVRALPQVNTRAQFESMAHTSDAKQAFETNQSGVAKDTVMHTSTKRLLWRSQSEGKDKSTSETPQGVTRQFRNEVDSSGGTPPESSTSLKVQDLTSSTDSSAGSYEAGTLESSKVESILKSENSRQMFRRSKSLEPATKKGRKNSSRLLSWLFGDRSKELVQEKRSAELNKPVSTKEVTPFSSALVSVAKKQFQQTNGVVAVTPTDPRSRDVPNINHDVPSSIRKSRVNNVLSLDINVVSEEFHRSAA